MSISYDEKVRKLAEAVAKFDEPMAMDDHGGCLFCGSEIHPRLDPVPQTGDVFDWSHFEHKDGCEILVAKELVHPRNQIDSTVYAFETTMRATVNAVRTALGPVWADASLEKCCAEIERLVDTERPVDRPREAIASLIQNVRDALGPAWRERPLFDCCTEIRRLADKARNPLGDEMPF